MESGVPESDPFRRPLSLGLSIAAIGVTAYLFARLAICGAERVSAVVPGRPMPPPECVPVFHPVAFLLLAAALAGAVLAWTGKRLALAALGVSMAAIGILTGLSLGLVGLAAGLLTLGAAFFAEPPRRSVREAP